MSSVVHYRPLEVSTLLHTWKPLVPSSLKHLYADANTPLNDSRASLTKAASVDSGIGLGVTDIDISFEIPRQQANTPVFVLQSTEEYQEKFTLQENYERFAAQGTLDVWGRGMVQGSRYLSRDSCSSDHYLRGQPGYHRHFSERVNRNEVVLRYIRTACQVADCLTKALPYVSLKKALDMLGVRAIGSKILWRS
ncbi:hypothetical protein BT69DRAFT_1331025 [Atractiella rhizophila]|nr:hypothetical protein BT69DRAFT_1331025 [Atractiella rhizophila]